MEVHGSTSSGFSYCPANVSLSDLWLHHGLSECFLDTISFSFAAFILVFGFVQYSVYKRYATPLSLRSLPQSKLYRLQVTVSLSMPFLALLRLLVRLFVLKDTLLGYMVVGVLCQFLMWPTSVFLVLLERWRALPSVPTWGHGLVLLLFWTMAFVKENLAFLNLRNREWWFDVETRSDRVEMGFFVARYVLTMFLFAVGIRAPGIPTAKDYSVHARRDIEGELTEPLLEDQGGRRDARRRTRTSGDSAFSDFWNKCRCLLPFVWPRHNAILQLRVLACFGLLAAGRVVNVFVPLFYKKIVDSLSAASGGPQFEWGYILTYCVLYFLQGQGTGSFLTNLRSYLWIAIQQHNVRELQVHFYSHLLRLSLRWHVGRRTGEVLRILDRGTDSVTNLLGYILFNIVPAIADVAVAVAFLSVSFGPWFGLVVFVTMTTYLASTVAMTEWRTKFRREMNDRDNEARATSVDALINYETVKYYNAEDHETANYRACIERYQASEWRTSASLCLLNVTQNFVITTGVLSGTLLCARLVVTERTLTAGDYVLFTAYLTQLYGPLGFFGTYYRMIQRCFIDVDNMFEILREEPEVVDKPDARELEAVRGEVEFRNVSFWYEPGRIVLRDTSFVVPAGKTVAIVGPSGSGKTTVIRLLFRFYDVQAGAILIDGVDVRDVTKRSLRQHVGVVPQDSVLFNRDVRYNVRYGNVDASDGDVERAARSADIHDRVISFPSGYETVVGERGLELSGGEKQRIAIARTILKDPTIILLDEATSSLDSHTERNVQESLRKVWAERTTIVVAHRLSTVVDADLILVMEDGQIKERGTHEELLALDGLYKAMWTRQICSKEAEEDSGGDRQAPRIL